MPRRCAIGIRLRLSEFHHACEAILARPDLPPEISYRIQKVLDRFIPIADIQRLKLQRIKLLPYSQFFNPSQNENMDLLLEYSAATGSVILSHSGCGAGPFEVPELSQGAYRITGNRSWKKYPDVPLVLVHFDAYSSYIPGSWLYEVIQFGPKYPNVYAGLAAVDWLLDREMVIKEICKTIGCNRVLFTTDYPLPLSTGVSLAYLVGALKANTMLTG